MANLGKIIYGKQFQQEQRTENISPHGSPEMREYWGENYEDEKIRNELNNKFSLNMQIGNYLNFGFDGRFNYTFRPFGCPTIKENKQNGPNTYRQQYLVEKTGNIKDKCKLADIETFLLIAGFIGHSI
ncbi:MAG: hypothetical protein KKG94_05015 [Nanoarchaeota archaeon]|nr:hypothetical protein [Nanoarchaeota archaeon]